MFTHIAVVRDLVDTQYKEYQEVRSHNHNKDLFCIPSVGKTVPAVTFL